MAPYPIINFYDQDISSLYLRTWQIPELYDTGNAITDSFHMVYHHERTLAPSMLDDSYDFPETSAELYAWAEHNLYHKIGSKKRIRETLPRLCEMFDSTMDYVLITTGCINAFYLSDLASIINDTVTAAKYGRIYYHLKTQIRGRTFSFEEDPTGHLLLAGIPTQLEADVMILQIKSLPTNPEQAFVLIKGLEKYGRFELARELAIRYLYDMTERALAPGDAIATVPMFIENVLGLYLSVPKKRLEWKITGMEHMGIENLAMRPNIIGATMKQHDGKWRIKTTGRKLFYFTADLTREHRLKTLPIPCGGCVIAI